MTVTYPGVYLEEIPSGVRTITGVSTSVTAFIGTAKTGKINDPVRIHNFGDYDREFGGLDSDSEMSYAVNQFFLNGGSDAWIVRLAKNAAPAKFTLKSVDGKDVLTLTARSAGQAGNQIDVFVRHLTSSTFAITVASAGQVEEFVDLSIQSGEKRFVDKVINGSSQLVKSTIPAGAEGKMPAETRGKLTLKVASKRGAKRVGFEIALDGGELQPVQVAIPENDADLGPAIQNAIRSLHPTQKAFRDFQVVRTANELTLLSGSHGPNASIVVQTVETASEVLPLPAGRSPAVPASKLVNGTEEQFRLDSADAFSLFSGNEATRQGIFALDAVDFNILCLPGVTNPGVLSAAVAYCKKRRAFLIIDGPPDMPPSQVIRDVLPSLPKSDDADHAAVYYPWVNIGDPLDRGRLRLSAPSGTIAGVFARTDATRGVWKAPAGIDASLRGVHGLGFVMTDDQNGELNPLGINCLRALPAVGPVVWGARTRRGDDSVGSEYKYVPVRRLASFIKESLFRGTQWVVFEPNDEPLWAQIRLNVGAFMNDLFRQGAFQGKTPREAYFVKCDRETTTQSDINKGIVNVAIGFAPLKPAEFVIITLQQMAGQVQA